MNSKMNKAFFTVLGVAAILHLSEATGSLLLDKPLIFLMFKKFLVSPFLVGRRSVEPARDLHPTAEQYLAMAASMDTDFCLPVAICSAMARARLSSTIHGSRSKFDDLIIRTFEMKLNGENVYGLVYGGLSRSPLNMYVEAARFGRHVGVPEACRQVSPTCKVTVEELRLITIAISDSNL